jgi:hypothetical protein
LKEPFWPDSSPLRSSVTKRLFLYHSTPSLTSFVQLFFAVVRVSPLFVILTDFFNSDSAGTFDEIHLVRSPVNFTKNLSYAFL